MAAGDLFQVKFGQQGPLSNPNDILNLFHYRQTAGSGGAAELRAAFVAGPIVGIQAIQSNGIAWNSILTENLDDLTDFDLDTTISLSGPSRTGDMLPEWECWKFQYIRTSRANRHGWKRIAGITETDQHEGLPASGLATALAACAVSLGATLTDLSGNAWSPRIYRAPGDKYYLKAHAVVHKVYTRDDFPIQSVQFDGIGTQNTRKR